MIKKYEVLLPLLLLSGCVSYSDLYDEMMQDMQGSGQPENISPCHYESIDADEIILETKSDVPQQGGYGEFATEVTPSSFGYASLQVAPSPSAAYIPYEPYQNLEGKVVEEVPVKNDPYNTIAQVEELTRSYFKIVLSNCDVVYVNTGLENLEYVDKEVYERALELNGKTIWADSRRNVYKLSNLFGAETELSHIEEVTVINVLPATYSDLGAFISHSVLKVETSDGEIAFLPFNINYFFEEYPIKDEWSETRVSLIKNQRYTIGMTKYQVRLSLGNPNDINRSVGEWGQHDQWVYRSLGNRFYLYFEDGVLTSYQN